VFDTQLAPGAGAGARGALTGTGTAQYGDTGGSGVVPGTGGAITLDTDAEVGGTGGMLTLTGAITGAACACSRSALGTVVLGNAANDYSGGTTISDGTLKTSAASVLPDDKEVQVAAGLLDIQVYNQSIGKLLGAGNIELGTAATLTVRDGDFAGHISGAGKLSKTSTGPLILSSSSNYTGGTTIQEGTLTAGDAQALGGGLATVASGATLNIADKVVLSMASGLNLSGSGVSGAGALTGTGTAQYMGDVTLSADSLVGAATGAQLTLTGAITGNAALFKVGAGTVVLSSQNDYQQGTVIQQGTLTAGDAKALGDGSVTIKDGGTLEIANVALALGSSAKITIEDDTPATAGSVGGTLSGTGGILASYGGALELSRHSPGGGGRANVGADGGAILTLDGKITGAGRLYKVGAGTVVLGNAANDYSGGTTISDGTLKTSAASVLPDDEEVQVAAGLLDIQVHNQSVGKLLGAGNIELGTAATLTVRDGDFAGHISGAGKLSKTSTGSLILSSSSNYTGGTTIQEGTLTAGDAQALGGGLATVASGATLNIADKVVLSMASGLNLSGLGVSGAGALTGTGTAQYMGGVTLSADSHVGAAAGAQLTLTGAITGPHALFKVGAGTVVLSSPNTYVNGTVIQQGTLTAGDAKALGDGVAKIYRGATLNIADGKTLSLPGGLVFDPQLAPGAGAGARGALTGTGTAQGGTGGVGGAITLEADAEVGGTGGTLTLTGAITGNAALFKVGAGTVVLSSQNDYQQGTVIQEGTLTAGHAKALGDGVALIRPGATLNIADGVTLTLSNKGVEFEALPVGYSGPLGALTGSGSAQYGNSLGADGAITLRANARVGAATGDQLTLTGRIAHPIPGSYALFKVGAGTVALTHANTYAGGTTIEQGTLTAGDAQALGDGVATIYRGATLNIADGKTLSLPGGLVFDPQLAPGAGAGARGALTGTGTAQGGTGGVGGAITLEADAEVGGTGGTLTLTGAITGPHALFKVGAGTVVLSSANFYTLGTTIQEGTLTAGDAQALGDGVAKIYRGATLNIADGKTLSLPGGLVFDPQLAPGAGAGARGALTGSGTAQYGDTVGVGGAITLNTDAEVGGTGGTLTLTGAITGAGRLYKVGAGTVVLGNAANDYSGGTTISDGTLKTSAASVLPDDKEVQVAAGLLDIQVYNQSIGKLLGAGNIELGTAATLTVRDGDFAGHISGAGKLSKTSTGPLILSSSSNYTGGTTIQEGTLTAGDAQALGGGLATVASGATLNIADNVVLSMASGLNLSGSGVSGAGALTGTGTAQYMGGVTLSADSHVGAATGAQLTLTGAITGPHALFKVGAGTVVLSSANSYTLGTTIQEGTLTAGDAKALGDGVATIYRGATLNIADGKTLSLPGGLVFDPQLAPGAGAGARGALTGTGTAQGGTGGVGGAITLEADAEVGGTGGTLTLTGAITGPHALFKVGAGTVVLSSANFYTLGTTIQEGTLTAGDAKALGDGVATIYRGATLNIADGKTLSLPGGLVFDTQLAPGAGAGARGALTGTGTAQYGDTVGVGGAITLNTDAEVGGTGGMLTLTGAITGAGRLYKVGAGTVVLGNAANDYSGGTTISDGTLKTSAASVLPDDEEVQVAAGLLDIQVHNQSVGKLLGAGNIELGTAATLTVRDGDFAGHISGAGKLSKTSTGSLILSSSSNYTGGTIIQEGTLTAGDAQALGGGLATVASGATLNIADKVVLSMASGLNLSGSGVSGAGALTGTGTAQYMGGVTLSADSHVGAATGAQLTLTGAITGPHALFKVGAGTVVLSSANSYTLGTTIQEGTLTAGDAKALGDGVATIYRGATLNIADGKTLSLPGGLVFDPQLAPGAGAGARGALTGTGTAQGGTGGVGGAITLDTDAEVGGTGGTLTLTGAITGVGGLYKVGAGTVALSSANTYKGGTLIQEGTLSAQNGQALNQGAVRIYRGATLEIADGVTLTLPNGGLVFDPQLAPGAGAGARGALTGSGTAQYGGTGGFGGAITLDTDAEVGGTGGTLTLTGAITGPHALFKVGAGTVVVSSANTYTQGTIIQEGTLTAGDAQALGDGVARIYRGATLNIADGKTLSLPGGLVFDTQLAPGAGAGARGALTGSGTAQYGSTGGVGGAIKLEADAEVGAANASDRLVLSGAIDGNGKALTVSGQGTVVLEGGVADAASMAQRVGGTIDLGVGQTVATRFGQVYDGVVTGRNVTLRSTQSGSIRAANVSNDFTGRVTVDAKDVTLHDASDLSLAGSVTGNLISTSQALLLGPTTVSGTAVLNADRAVTQDGDVRVTGTTAINAAGQTVLLDRVANDFTGRVTVDAGDVTLRDASDLSLAGSITGNLLSTSQALLLGPTTVGGTAVLNADRAVTQDGDVRVTGTTAINAAGQTVLLDRVANDFTGRVTVDAGDVTLRDASDLSLAGSITGNLISTSQALLLGPTTVGGTAVLNADRAVTQDGDVRVTGTTAINAAGQTVLLDRVANDFTGRVTVDAGDVTLRDASDLSLAGSITGNLISTSQALLLGTTTVDGTAVLNADRAVTQDGDVRVTGTTAINAAGQTVLLNRVANDFTGRVTVDAGDVTLRDASDLSLAGSITGNLISTSQALLLGPTTVSGTAVLNADRAVTQDGDVRVTGTTAINAAGQTVLLDRVANDFTGRVTVDAGDVTLRDASDLSLAGSITGNLLSTSQALLLGPTTVGGTAVLNADRAVTQDGDVRVTGTTAINAAGQTVLLDRVANDFTGRVTVDAGDVTLRDASDLSLAGSITGNLISTSQALLLGTTTVDGTAVLNADRAVTQDGDVRVTGTTAINAAGQTVLLNRVANDFTGRVTVDAGDVTLRDASDLSLAGSITGNLISTSQALLLGPTTVSGTAVLNADRAVTQDGDVRVTGTTAINAAGQTVLLDRVANDFTGRVTVDAGDVTLRDASDLSLAGSITGNLLSTSQALLLGPTTVGGTAVLNADRAVTQDGDVRVTGTTAINAAGQTVLLDRVANDFTGRVTVDAQRT
jgi:fibronectin-binding autotransporter adhesin